LLREAGLEAGSAHYRRRADRPFLAEERQNTTILFGTLTPKHEAFIKAVFEGCGYLCQNLPAPTKISFQVGKQYCNNGLCNPNYFTAGNLIQYLQDLAAGGMSPQEVSSRFLYFTAGGCGPCRFGMYESEYRQALENAGFPEFRVLTFQSNKVIQEGSQEPGLQFTMDLGLGALNALILGDLLYALAYQIRPYEIHPGQTDQVMQECVDELAEFLRNRERFEILERTPAWLSRRLARKKQPKNFLNNLGKFREHLYGKAYQEILARCARRLDQIELDRTRPKPVVKIVGEFFSQIQESDANYHMFRFLEQEGAEVAVDPIAGLLQYWLYQAERRHGMRKGLDVPYPQARAWQLGRLLSNQWSFRKKPLLLRLAAGIYGRQYHRTARALGGLAHKLPPQQELAQLAEPFFSPLTRGGEGHLEIGKSIYYSQHRHCHLVLSLKPFGCMPSTQSDAAMAAVTSRYEDLLFLSLETSGDGEINAYSRVQMVLGEAQRKARAEFNQALQFAKRPLEEIRAYVFARPELRRPSYAFPRSPGTAGVAASFVQHVARLMDAERKPPRRLFS
jgi:predicted nucleotide-binding protein (sugar kinase/HSP70/actin superfamily)